MDQEKFSFAKFFEYIVPGDDHGPHSLWESFIEFVGETSITESQFWDEFRRWQSAQPTPPRLSLIEANLSSHPDLMVRERWCKGRHFRSFFKRARPFYDALISVDGVWEIYQQFSQGMLKDSGLDYDAFLVYLGRRVNTSGGEVRGWYFPSD